MLALGRFIGGNDRAPYVDPEETHKRRAQKDRYALFYFLFLSFFFFNSFIYVRRSSSRWRRDERERNVRAEKNDRLKSRARLAHLPGNLFLLRRKRAANSLYERKFEDIFKIEDTYIRRVCKILLSMWRFVRIPWQQEERRRKVDENCCCLKEHCIYTLEYIHHARVFKMCSVSIVIIGNS